MVSPTPISLICAVLLCLPLAVVFTITNPTSSAYVSRDASVGPELFLGPKRHQKFGLRPIASPPPPPVIIPKDDDSLLRYASRVNSRPLPRTAPKKVAFMFLTTTPLPFSPLWELFFAQASKSMYNIYIHADPTHDYDPPFSGVFANRTIRSEPSQRLSPSLSAAARRLLAHALLNDPLNAMFALLSPSCIPLRSFGFVYDTVARSKKSFIEILENEIGSYDRWAARGPDVMLPEVRLEDFRIGSQFWILTRKHARFVVRDRRLWAKFNLTCVIPDSCFPEENYFPTLLNRHDPLGCVRATLTHVDWEGSFDSHPRMYKASEVGPELILALREGRPRYGDEVESFPPSSNTSDSTVKQRSWHDPFLFARKFEPEALNPLMSIAGNVIFRD